MNKTHDTKGRFIVAEGQEPLAKNPIPVRLPASIDPIVRDMPNRSEWIRDAIIEKIKREKSKKTPKKG